MHYHSINHIILKYTTTSIYRLLLSYHRVMPTVFAFATYILPPFSFPFAIYFADMAAGMLSEAKVRFSPTHLPRYIVGYTPQTVQGQIEMSPYAMSAPQYGYTGPAYTQQPGTQPYSYPQYANSGVNYSTPSVKVQTQQPPPPVQGRW
jgi:hypothetical protein